MQGLEELYFTEEQREINLVITAVRNTHFIVYWYFEGNTNLHNGDVIVPVGGIEFFMYDDSCKIMNSSIRIGVSGARPHSDIVRIIPVDRKLLLFMLCTQSMEFYIVNSKGNLVRNIMYVYIHSVIKEVWNLL